MVKLLFFVLLAAQAVFALGYAADEIANMPNIEKRQSPTTKSGPSPTTKGGASPNPTTKQTPTQKPTPK